MRFIQKVGDKEVDLDQLSSDVNVKPVPDIWSADFGSAWSQVRQSLLNNPNHYSTMQFILFKAEFLKY